MTEKVNKEGRVKRYFKGVRTELKKVVWPSKSELLKYSALVLVLSIISALFIYLFDFIIHKLLGLVIG